MAQQRVLNLSSVEYDVDLDQIDLTLDWLNCSKFICGFCNRGFKYKHVKENHEMIHTGKKPFQCQICLQSFRRSHHLKTHLNWAKLRDGNYNETYIYDETQFKEDIKKFDNCEIF